MNGAAVLAPPKVSEQQILNAILQYLTIRRIPHAHVRNSGNIIHRPGGQIVFGRPKFYQAGVADILACYKNIPLAIEVKAHGGRLSEEQRGWLFRWEANGGGTFAVVYGVEEVEKLLQKIDSRAQT